MRLTQRQFSLRLAAAVIATATVGVAAFRLFAPWTPLTLHTDVVTPGQNIRGPKPNGRMDGGELLDSSVYFDVFAPPGAKNVTVNVSYENPGGVDVLVGGLTSLADQRYRAVGFSAPFLDSLGWTESRDGAWRMLRKTDGAPSRLDAPAENVARYESPLLAAQPLPASMGSTRGVFDVSLRGSHQFLVAVRGGAFDATFTVQDMNREQGADDVRLSLSRIDNVQVDKEVASATLADDSNASDNQHASGLRTVALAANQLADGVYRLNIDSTPDVFIRKISTSTPQIVALRRLYMGDFVGYTDRVPVQTVYASARRVSAHIAHPDAEQRISVDGQSVALSDPLSVARFSTVLRPAPIVIPKGDVILESDGVFALSRDSYFDPLASSVDRFDDANSLATAGIDAVATTFLAPTRNGDAYSATATFSAKDLAKTADGAYRFALLVPMKTPQERSLTLRGLTFTIDKSGGAQPSSALEYFYGESLP